jgi:hypothetical protein
MKDLSKTSFLGKYWFARLNRDYENRLESSGSFKIKGLK